MECAFKYPEMRRVDDVSDFVGVKALRKDDRAAFEAKHAAYFASPPQVDAEVITPPLDPLIPTPNSCLGMSCLYIDDCSYHLIAKASPSLC